MKYRVISGVVTVTGPPFSICLRNVGMTLPDELSTLPKRTGDEARRDVATVPERLDDPLAERLRLAHHRLRVDGLVGRDEHEALDLEVRGELRDDLRRDDVVLRTDSSGCVSISGTCLYAAAWKTIVGWYFSKTSRRIAFGP